MPTVHSARIGDIVVGRGPDLLEALALGSCVAAFIYDEVNKTGACVHILLPDSTMFPNRIAAENKPGKYADTGIPETLKLLSQKGAKRDRLKAKIAGGARMFSMTGKTQGTLDVGARNIEAVKKILRELNISVVADDTGNDYGRTVIFDLDTSVMTVKLGLKKLIRHH